jgi:glucose-6-phosphate 1-dehydrogenase
MKFNPYRLEKGNFLEPDTRIIAVDRLEEDSASFIKIAYKSLQDFLGEPLDEAIWKKYSARLSYQKMDLTQPEEYKIFNQLTDSSKRVMVNYFAVAPFLFQHICKGLKHSNCPVWSKYSQRPSIPTSSATVICTESMVL